VSSPAPIEDLLRELAPQVLGALVRRYGDFDTCEDAVQEALLAAALQWPADGTPANPKGWLTTVASRRWVERWRQEAARRRREQTAAALAPPQPEPVPGSDDTLTLLLLCCHPSLTRTSQVALTLRAVGGLTTAEIARAFLVPEATVAQRISRAKQRIRASGAEFRMPSEAERPERIAAVLQVLYLIFNEGYTASAGPSLHRVELTSHAIRLARQLHQRFPADGEVAGLLALMLLTDARRPARTGPDGTLVPLASQDRGRWDVQAIAEGTELITRALASAPIGPYQLQAAIAAVHDEAARFEDTDWDQILGLYELLGRLTPGPMVDLNRIVAVAMVHGPQAGLRRLASAEADPVLAGHHRLAAVRAHLLELAGDQEAAHAAYLLAARRTLSLPEQRYLRSRAARLQPQATHDAGRRHGAETVSSETR
jgi:RNA polymerase sigma factor (sigma-70 family)